MNDREYIPELLKLVRPKVDDELWVKLMKLFVHGEELMAIEILCEELLEHKKVLNANEKDMLKRVALYVDLDFGAYCKLIN
jgi:hypothetical protein